MYMYNHSSILCLMYITKVLYIILIDTLSNAACTVASLSVSNAEVASSSSSILGSLTKALAIAIRCFCPPLSAAPLSPTSVLNFCKN